MKKILLAASALALSAGAVSAQNVSSSNADWSLGGYARFGIGYVENRADEWQTATRLRLQFQITTTTDGGVTIGARQRFQTEENAANGGGNAAHFFVAYEGLRVAMGNIIGVVEGTPLLYMNTRSAGVGLEGNGFGSLAANTVSNGGAFGWTAYQSAGNVQFWATNAIEASYTFQDITVRAHMTDDTYALGASGTFQGFTAAIAYEKFNSGARNGDDYLFAGLGYDAGPWDVALTYARTEVAAVKANKWALKGGYDVMPDTNVYGYVARENNGVGTSYGLGASYALGGGASLEGGIARTRDFAGNGTNRADFGIFFSF
jgi:outer membrane protein OmpU